MNRARNKKTGLLVEAINIPFDGSYPEPHKETWYADPALIDIENSDLSKVEDVEKIEVNYRTDHWRTGPNGEQHSVVNCFAFKKGEKENLKERKESREHLLCKTLIINYIQTEKLTFFYSTTKGKSTTPLSYKLFDLAKVSIEQHITNTSGWRIADILLPFKKLHPLLGEGIIIEIQFSPQTSAQEDERTQQYAFRGFSTTWLRKYHFKHYDENNPHTWDRHLKNLDLRELEIVVRPFLQTLEENTENQLFRIQRKVEQACMYLDEKKKSILDVFDSEKVLAARFNAKLKTAKCNICGQKGFLVYASGISKHGKKWHAGDCTFCEKQGKGPSRNFLNNIEFFLKEEDSK